MQINSAAQFMMSSSAHPATEKCHEEDNKKIANDAVQEKTVDTVEITATDETKAAGVLKNLQEGRYKGVADVRLRINFAEQIAALNNAQATAIATEGASAAVQTVTGQLSTLLENGNLSDDQAAAIGDAFAAFESGANSSIENLTGNATSPETAIADIRSYFVVLIDAILAATTPTESDATESTDESVVSTIDAKNVTVANAAIDTLTTDIVDAGDPVVTTDDAPEFSVESFLADLIDSFELTMQQLIDKLDSSTVLPEISEPNGQGKAFDKFMAIYNAMNQPVIESPTASEVNVVL